MSFEHAYSTAPGSSGSSQSTPSWLSKLVRSFLMSRLKACFHGVVELTASSLNTCFDEALRCVASVSPDPAMVKRRIRFCSTWMRGSNRDLMLRICKVWCERWFWVLCDVDGPSSSGFWSREIASRMIRKDWTMFNWITAIQDARSSRNDYNRFIISYYTEQTELTFRSYMSWKSRLRSGWFMNYDITMTYFSVLLIYLPKRLNTG